MLVLMINSTIYIHIVIIYRINRYFLRLGELKSKFIWYEMGANSVF